MGKAEKELNYINLTLVSFQGYPGIRQTSPFSKNQDDVFVTHQLLSTTMRFPYKGTQYDFMEGCEFLSLLK